MALFCNMRTGLLVQVLRKMFLSLRPLKIRISQDLHPVGYDLKCVQMKEQVQAHYFGTILAIPVPV